MDSELGFVVDFTQVAAGIKKLVSNIPDAQTISALAIGYEVLRLSQVEVPHDKGMLQNSGTVEQIDDVVIVGYHEPYAARLHEHPEYRFRGGRKGKYLEDPIVTNLAPLGITFAKNFEKGLTNG